jgi:hypothetical protein
MKFDAGETLAGGVGLRFTMHKSSKGVKMIGDAMGNKTQKRK